MVSLNKIPFNMPLLLEIKFQGDIFEKDNNSDDELKKG
jgi:hypothetical protein